MANLPLGRMVSRLLFFKEFWNLVEDDLMRMFKDFNEGNLNIQKLNYGVISLIPKALFG
jgi:hypothetical protein